MMVLPIASSFARAGEQSSSLQIASLVDVSTTRDSNGTIYEAEVRQFHRYTPAYITVRPGTTIIWTNNDVVEHNVHVLQGDKNELSNDIISPLIFPKETTAITFNHEGDYRYFCDANPYMQGYVYVNNTDEITRPPE
jgi:plastocyanin